MSETITKYKIFVASPGDLEDERLAVDEVVRELNITFGKTNNLIIEVVKWETHSAPGVSQNHVQEIINKDIGNDYDIFIGMLWLKFGTKTISANSGTEEEFNIAYEKFTNNPNSVQILFYFNNQPPISLEDIDIEELRKINEFKCKIGDEGVLYWKYKDINEFKSFLRHHIPQRIKDLRDQKRNAIKKINEKSLPELKSTINEELGLFDLQEIFAKNLDIAISALNNITSATGLIGEQFTSETDKILRLQNKPINIKNYQLKIISKTTAKYMLDYSDKLETESINFYKYYNNVLDAVFSWVEIAEDFASSNDVLLNMKNDIEVTNASMKNSLEKIEVFSVSIEKFPRIEKELISAKKKTVKVVRDFCENIKQCIIRAEGLVLQINNKTNKII